MKAINLRGYEDKKVTRNYSHFGKNKVIILGGYLFLLYLRIIKIMEQLLVVVLLDFWGHLSD